MKKEIQDMFDKQKRWQSSRKSASWEDKLRDSIRLRSLALQLKNRQISSDSRGRERR